MALRERHGEGSGRQQDASYGDRARTGVRDEPPAHDEPPASDEPPAPDEAGRPPGPPGPRRGRPRSQAVERAIADAVLHLVDEGVSPAEMSVERIARTAGVGKATIYRRWPGKDELLADVLATVEGPPPRPRGRSVRDDLVALVDFLRTHALDRRSAALLHLALTDAGTHPALARRYREAVLAPRRAAVREVLRRGVASGELRADLDPELLTDLFTGPVLARAVLYPGQPPPAGPAARIVDAVLDGVRSPDR
ncbi:TetR/AcrR family transcriptional regulator [Streptomyces sp. NBC_01808]|uniref:TetR/AcrR family transcriptional regulator n=1 Tax=Streptomyces sp. NBC_01808 TaxID=2975947 RepID=UPI002DD7AEE9|nr:TetR/AcrR family transcriptional regulator [Streptomyces sp. NBC_01808]WSA37427.1 TetR/AcrR family transcriptional regulator [Streptomyces sp. NBC_01808]